MTEAQWKTFLEEHNRELLSYEEVVERLPLAILKGQALGNAGASETDLAAAEKRLGAKLPPSYRAFLKTSDGWKFASLSAFKLFGARELKWFSQENQDWIDAYVEPSKELPEIGDAEHRVYGDKQDCCRFRTEYLQTALQISDEPNGSVVLLNPKVVTGDGEWETWYFSNSLPGAERFQSFAEWFETERARCREHLTKLTPKQLAKYLSPKLIASAKKAQSAARAGKIEIAMASLEEFAAKGEQNAVASLAEIYAFQGDWPKAIAYAQRFLMNPSGVYAGNVFDDLFRLMGTAGHRSGDWKAIEALGEAGVKAEKQRDYKAGAEGMSDRNIKLFQNLIAYARRKGAPPDELLRIFGMISTNDSMTLEERKGNFEKAVRDVDSLRPDLKKRPEEKPRHFFSLAMVMDVEDEAVRIYEERNAQFSKWWDASVYVAHVYCKRGDAAAAWRTIERSLKYWYPVDFAQVAPLVLLYDKHLRELMTPERCALVLKTPRGSEGEN